MLVRESAAAWELKDCVWKAYEDTLSKHHFFYVRWSVRGGMSLVPARKGFMEKLATTEKEALAKIGELLPPIEHVLKINEQYLTTKGPGHAV